MQRIRNIVPLSAAVALVLAGPSSAQNENQSCVGWFASTFASQDHAFFGSEISGFAHEDQPFGFTTVAPFAHLPLEVCQED